ncbi:MAG: caspase family protein [Spirochaetia bacterium]|nr:caspase family protein [Spirochaetia bacterium]
MKHRWPFLLGMLFCLFSCSVEPISKPKMYFLAAGCDYANSPVQTLRGTIPDVKEMAACMQNLAWSSGTDMSETVMMQEGPDREQTNLYPDAVTLRTRLQEFAAQTSSSAIFVLYFSGHGTSNNGDVSLALAATDEVAYTTFPVSAV